MSASIGESLRRVAVRARDASEAERGLRDESAPRGELEPAVCRRLDAEN
jgi:hypothetical protein